MRRRLTRAFGAMIASTIIGAGFAVALLAYAVQMHALANTCEQTRRIVDDVVVAYRVARYDGRGKVEAIMAHVVQPGFLLVVNDRGVRYDGRWLGARGGERAPYAVSVQRRSDYLASARKRTFPTRAANWLAALAGYKGSLTHAGSAEVAVIADPRQLRSIAARTLLVMLSIVPSALLLGAAGGSAMSRKALQPLVLVSDALEAFAAGKLAPPVPAHSVTSDEAGRLTHAYNAAMATVDRAFAERMRAEAQTRQFISDASHQLRTPLTVLRGFIGILRRREFDTPDELARIVETMDAQSAIMTSLMRKLTLLETWEQRPAPRDVAIVDVAAAVEQIVAPIADSHRHRDVRLRLSPGAFAAIDTEELGYAVGNLVTNALNYAPDGTIDVEVATRRNEVLAVVTDQGPGMTPDELQHAFDRFYRGTRRDVAGSGLGLAIAQRAVERAGGTLTVASVPGFGCRFAIALPLTSDPASRLISTA